MDAQLIGALKFAIRQFVSQRAGLFPSPQIGLCWAILLRRGYANALEAVASEIRDICPRLNIEGSQNIEGSPLQKIEVS